jgi:hypothetical protein
MEFNKKGSTPSIHPSNFHMVSHLSEIHVTCPKCKRKFHKDNYAGHERYEKELEMNEIKIDDETNKNKPDLVINEEKFYNRRVKTFEHHDEIHLTGDNFIGTARDKDLLSKSEINISQKNKVVSLNKSPFSGPMKKDNYSPLIICQKCKIEFENLDEPAEKKTTFLHLQRDGIIAEYTCAKCRMDSLPHPFSDI